MDIDLPAGKYVIAVSGGVDSMALLHMLARRTDIQFTVAHFDHGIREDSATDRRLVQSAAKAYDLPFVYHQGKLGPKASEAIARQARYDFLHRVRNVSEADAVVTAHHQDDVLETIVLNLLRGTGRRGLSSLKSGDAIKRPLLQIPKKELLRYAKREGLSWREDSTNADDRYMRNYIRHHIMPRFAKADREALLRIAVKASTLNEEITQSLVNYLQVQPAQRSLDRHEFIMLPHGAAREVMAEWLLQNTTRELSRPLIERLVVAAKTGRTGSKVDIDTKYWLHIAQKDLALTPRER